MGMNKALGLDGILPLFYQKFWDILGLSGTQFIQHIFRVDNFLFQLNATLISFISKTDVPELVSQFRPIALCNVLMKVITNVIANRLKPLMSKLIGNTHSSFILGKQAADNIIIAQEVIHSMVKMKGKQGLIAIKIDLENAYDRIEWDFLEEVLQKVGFEDHLLQLIMYCTFELSLSILWNGTKHDSFQPLKGIRQGDPLSSRLFVFCMEVLIHHIDVVVVSKWTTLK